ncbi:MAG: GNAT family N-acetyltransferase [Ignavibacteria bacterium]|nr:GNAT family N-acetyltransferase [Ignavibacteria bacterium]
MNELNSKNYLFKEMEVSHYEKAAELWSVTVGLGPNDTRNSIESFLQKNTGMSFVCIHKETSRLVGAVLAGNDGRYGYIYHLAVSEDHRSNKIGKKLLTLSTNAINRAGIKRCIAAVKTSNAEGLDFWKKIGWNNLYELNLYSVVM